MPLVICCAAIGHMATVTKGIQMFTRKAITSAVAVAALAASTLTAFAPSAAVAGDRTVAASAASNTDFSAARRHYARRGYGGGGAAAAAFAGILGTGLAIAATQSRRDDYYYEGGPGYYGGGQTYYGGGPYESYGYAPGPGYGQHYRAW